MESEGTQSLWRMERVTNTQKEWQLTTADTPERSSTWRCCHLPPCSSHSAECRAPPAGMMEARGLDFAGNVNQFHQRKIRISNLPLWSCSGPKCPQEKPWGREKGSSRTLTSASAIGPWVVMSSPEDRNIKKNDFYIKIQQRSPITNILFILNDEYFLNNDWIM